MVTERHRNGQEHRQRGRDWHDHNEEQQAQELCTYQHYSSKHIPPLLPYRMTGYNNHPHLHYYCRQVSNKIFISEGSSLELPQFSGGVSLAAAAAEKGQ